MTAHLPLRAGLGSGKFHAPLYRPGWDWVKRKRVSLPIAGPGILVLRPHLGHMACKAGTVPEELIHRIGSVAVQRTVKSFPVTCIPSIW